MNVWCHATCRPYTSLAKRKTFAIYRRRTHSRCQIALIPVVSYSGITYANVVSVPTEEHNRYMIYITTYLLSGTHAFNVAWIALHMLQECIHVLRKWPQEIPRSPHPMCAVVTHCTIDTQPLPHDRDCPQASLILRGRVQDSHHPMGGYLLSYIVVSALLQNSKLHEVNTESKSMLACHLLRLL
jgi:hypothetical protein